MYKLGRMFTAAVAATGIACASASAADINVGILVGFTGPTESEAPNYARAAELAADDDPRRAPDGDAGEEEVVGFP